MQRFNSYFDARKDLQPRLPLGPAYYMGRFCYDTAFAATIYPLAALTKLVKPTQILFGTDYPFGSAKIWQLGCVLSGCSTPRICRRSSGAMRRGSYRDTARNGTAVTSPLGSAPRGRGSLVEEDPTRRVVD
jgi:hypothetical protein